MKKKNILCIVVIFMLIGFLGVVGVIYVFILKGEIKLFYLLEIVIVVYIVFVLL